MKILYAEPDLSSREFLIEIIEAELDGKFELTETSSVGELLQLVEFEEFDFIITDYLLGKDLCESLVELRRAKKLKAQIIFFSRISPSTNDSLKDSINDQTIFYIKKSLTMGPVMELVKLLKVQGGLSLVENEPSSLAEENSPKKGEETKSNDQDNEFDQFQWDNQSQEQTEVEADWSLNKKPGQSKEEAADWSLKAESHSAKTEEADWSLEKKRNASQAQEADWSLKNESESAQEDADWSLKNESESAQEDADWSLKNESESAQEDADWSLKNESESAQEDADWSLRHSSNLQDLTGENDNRSKPVTQESKPEYYFFPIARIFIFEKLPMDVYLPLSKRKTLKLINEDEALDHSRIKSLKEKNVQNLCILYKDKDMFLDAYEGQLSSKLSEAKKRGSSKAKVLADQLGLDYVYQQISHLDISPRLKRSVDNVVDSIMEKVTGSEDLYNLFSNVFSKGSFILEHSILLSYLAVNILKKVGWDQGKSTESMMTACLLHDSLFDDDKLARVYRTAGMKELSREDQEKVLNHGTELAFKLQGIPEISSETIKIIEQHHERPQNDGFPKGLDSGALSNLSLVFIVAEELLEILYQYDFDKEKTKNAWNGLKDYFDENYAKVLSIVDQMV